MRVHTSKLTPDSVVTYLFHDCEHRSRIRYLSKKNSRILTNFPKLKKIRKNSLNARVGVAFQQQLKNLMHFTVSC